MEVLPLSARHSVAPVATCEGAALLRALARDDEPAFAEIYQHHRGRERVVELRGEAFFAVFHEARRRFRVLKPQLETPVLGTSFTVRAGAGRSQGGGAYGRCERALAHGLPCKTRGTSQSAPTKPLFSAAATANNASGRSGVPYFSNPHHLLVFLCCTLTLFAALLPG